MGKTAATGAAGPGGSCGKQRLWGRIPKEMEVGSGLDDLRGHAGQVKGANEAAG